MLLAVEGIFIKLSEREDMQDEPWDWPTITQRVLDILEEHRQMVGGTISSLMTYAKVSRRFLAFDAIRKGFKDICWI